MINFSISASCDTPGCEGYTQHSGTVKQPSQSAVPDLYKWGGPFEGWSFELDKPTLCPSCARASQTPSEEPSAEPSVELEF